MTDIVKRLREPPFGTETSERNLMNAAADEITILRAEVDNLKRMVIAQEKLLRSKDAENEKLRAALEEIEYLDRPQSRGLPRRISIEKIARAALGKETNDE